MDINAPDPRHLLSFIRDAETSRGYEDWSGFSKIAPPRPVSQMTVGEIRNWQERNRRAGAQSTAIGGYQIIYDTFNATTRALGISDDTVFSPEVQDQYGMHLLRGRGYDKWAEGRMSDAQFMDNLAGEWAALPMATGPKRGRSRYAGDGLNAHTRGLDDINHILKLTSTGAEYDGTLPETTGVTSRQSQLINDFVSDDNDTSSFQAPRNSFVSHREEFLAREEAGDGPSFFEGAGAAIRNEWSVSWLARQAGQEEFTPDIEWMRAGISDELQQELDKRLPPQYHAGLEGATSAPHAQAIIERLEKDWEAEQKLQQLGGVGLGLRMGAAITDPLGIALSIGTAGMAAPAIGATRTVNALRAGTAAAGINAGLEGIITANDVSRGVDGVIMAAGAGFVLGGALGAFGRQIEDPLIEGAVNNIMAEVRARNPQLTGGPSSAGAMDVRAPTALTPAQQAAEAAANAPRSAFGAIRFDMVARMKQSESNIMRRIGGMMGEEGVGNADGSVVGRGATEEVQHQLNRRLTRFYRATTPNYRDWAKANNRSIASMDTRADFFNEVGKAVRRPLDATQDPHVQAVAKVMKRELADMLEFAKAKGIRGFDEVVENQNYLMRQFNQRRMDEVIALHGQGTVNRLVAESMISANRKARNNGKPTKELDYDDAIRMAAAYVKSIRNQRWNLADRQAALSGKDKDKISELLTDAIGRHDVGDGRTVDIDVSDVARLVDSVVDDARPADAGRIPQGKFRMQLDEEYALRTPTTGDNPLVSIEDLLENNAENLFMNYTRQVTGVGVMEDVLENFRPRNPDGTLGERPTFDQVKRWITEEATTKGLKQGKIKRDLERLDLMHKIVTARPVQTHTMGSEFFRMMRDYQFARVAGQMGLASIPEFGSIIAQGGVRAMVQNIPELRNIFTMARNGRFKSEYAQEIDELWSAGTDAVRRSPGYLTDDYGRAGGDLFDSRGVRQMDYNLQQLGGAVSTLGGMDHINAFLSRFGTRVAVQNFMNAAEGGRMLSKSRLRVLGLDDADYEAIMGQMRAHVSTQKGALGGRVRSINIDNWTDPQAAAKFTQAVDKWTRNMAMVQDAGTLPAFMSTHLGKTVGQFRSFMLSAYTKLLLSGMHHRDMTTALTFMSTMFFASLGYVAQQTINTAGLDNREELLAERLSPQSIAAASFQRGGFSTFVPALVDQMASMGGYDPIFNYRTTDLSTGIFGNPTLDFFDNAQRAASGITASLINPDYDFSQGDWRAVSSLFALHNGLLVRNVVGMVSDELPRFSQ